MQCNAMQCNGMQYNATLGAERCLASKQTASAPFLSSFYVEANPPVYEVYCLLLCLVVLFILVVLFV